MPDVFDDGDIMGGMVEFGCLILDLLFWIRA
jgi:hypothetical protein